jgi:hypothetical protein
VDKLTTITATPVRLKVEPLTLPVSSDDLELDIYAHYVIRNEWYYRDAEKPDVMIVGYTLAAKGGSGEVDAAHSFFSYAKRVNWEAEIAQQLEDLDRLMDIERGVA